MKPSRPLLTAMVVGVALVAAACGGDGNGAKKQPAKTVPIEMVDIAYKPPSVQVARGETLRFVFTNKGKLPHDAFIGDTAAQAEHEKSMREAEKGGHGGHGDDEDAITVQPGATGELTYTFDKAGVVEIGCHQAGHYAGGMKVIITVS